MGRRAARPGSAAPEVLSFPAWEVAAEAATAAAAEAGAEAPALGEGQAAVAATSMASTGALGVAVNVAGQGTEPANASDFDLPAGGALGGNGGMLAGDGFVVVRSN